ncbi:MAG: hypothetical protein E6J28_06875 [Chloroflexi bacterium]|nr:MAG: hypothetical protein E6J28_06875 [Chloroflexota bacterium]
MRLYITILLAALAALAAVLLGLWWAPFPVGVAMGAVVVRARIAVPAGAAVGLLSWLAPLAAAQTRYALGPTASALAAIMGLGHQPVLPVVLTLVGLAGGWLGSAARSLVAPSARVDANGNG